MGYVRDIASGLQALGDLSATAAPAQPEPSAPPPAAPVLPVPPAPPAPVEAAAALPLRFGPNTLAVLHQFRLGDREIELLAHAVRADRAMERLASFRPPSASSVLRRLARQEQHRERRPR